mmetsp:Transcript_83803/g.215756  ORF Transcript_83803/g.215756 Transcript_83803/m.215756 type:complete len:264 (-) Transcript_83803:2-793(-)
MKDPVSRKQQLHILLAELARERELVAKSGLQDLPTAARHLHRRVRRPGAVHEGHVEIDATSLRQHNDTVEHIPEVRLLLVVHLGLGAAVLVGQQAARHPHLRVGLVFQVPRAKHLLDAIAEGNVIVHLRPGHPATRLAFEVVHHEVDFSLVQTWAEAPESTHELLPRDTAAVELVEVPEDILHADPALEDLLLKPVEDRPETGVMVDLVVSARLSGPRCAQGRCFPSENRRRLRRLRLGARLLQRGHSPPCAAAGGRSCKCPA